MTEAERQQVAEQPFLFKTRDGILQAGKLRVTRIEKRRYRPVSGVIPGIGQVLTSDPTGRYETDKLRVAPQDNRYADGRGCGTHWNAHVPRSAAGVKAVVRRIRPEEAAAIAACDARIARLEEDLRKSREIRAEAVQVAWGKAHVVRLAEIESQIVGGW